MAFNLNDEHRSFMREAIREAEEAQRGGNLPIGAVIVLDGEIISRGRNSIWSPSPALTRHAEIEALRAVPANLWTRAREMTLYTTLEPCVMCAGAILLHDIGRLVFGSTDPYGGAGEVLGCLPPYFKEQLSQTDWAGPLLPEACDPLYRGARALENDRANFEIK